MGETEGMAGGKNPQGMLSAHVRIGHMILLYYCPFKITMCST